MGQASLWGYQWTFEVVLVIVSKQKVNMNAKNARPPVFWDVASEHIELVDAGAQNLLGPVDH